MKFSIRDLLLTKVIVILLLVTLYALSATTSSIAAESVTDGSFWVVSDAYFLGKPRRTAVGKTFVFWKGKLYWASKDGKSGGVHNLTIKTSMEEIRFTSNDSFGFGGKGILVQEKECLWIYWNVSDRNHEKIAEPSAAIGKCDSAYRCLPLEKKDALLDLEQAGIRLVE
jgi:hypothetical protein